MFRGVGAAFSTTGTGGAAAFSRDALGNTLTTTGTAAVTRASAFTAYGSPGTAGDGVALGYRGETHVDDTVDLRARVYDPATQRFLTRDPLDGHPGEPVATNPYHYAANDRVDNADPSGLDPGITDATIMAGSETVLATEGTTALITEEMCETLIFHPEAGTHSLSEDVSNEALVCTPTVISTAAKAAATTVAVVVGTAVVTGAVHDTPKTRRAEKAAKETGKLPGRVTNDTRDGMASMRFQVQWTNLRKRGDVTFALAALAPESTGVTVAQAMATLDAVVAMVVPARARTAAQPAVAAAKRMIQGGPPDGVIGEFKRSYYFTLGNARSARVDVENISGWNLRYYQ